MDQLEKDVQQIREIGWAQAEGERVPDAFGLAAPFFADDAVAGSLTFTIPASERRSSTSRHWRRC
jgi:DNA-binding IclR family transcriptional regulator